MEPIAVVMHALTAGAAAVGKGAADMPVRDAYDALRFLIQSRFQSNPAASTALAEYETDPETWEKPLAKAMTATGADRDPAIIQAANKLMELVQPPQGKTGKYNIQITGNVQGMVTGDNAQVTMNFGDDH